MVLAAQLKMRPNAVAEILKQQLELEPMFQSVSVAGPGFINFIIKRTLWQKELLKIMQAGDDYARSNIGQGKRINVEYASPNPTGPMHVGHARGTIYGDVLGSLLEYVGYKVVRECYINDAGNQVDTVARSICTRYMECCGVSDPKDFPQGQYPGQYIIDAAAKLKSEQGANLLSMSPEERHALIREFAINEMMALIKTDLQRLGVTPDIFFYESQLHKEGRLQQLIDELQKRDLVYRGVLDDPKGHEPDASSKQELLLFRATAYGDDIDRALQKSDGTWTYFAADSAYLADKVSRKFDELILVLGADHIGYKKRIQAMCSALNNGKCMLDVQFCQLVVYMQGGKPLKMSKRTGNFISVEQVLEMVGKDILRFMMLNRKNDVVMHFDVDEVREHSKDNPVFYAQYAHARGCSVLAGAAASDALAIAKNSTVDVALLVCAEELELMKILSYWPRQLTNAAINRDPSRVISYLNDVAAKFHGLWSAGKNDNSLRFIIEGNDALTRARLLLVMSTLKIISSGLKIIGVQPVTKM
jgi:arginyl-tRNA synthetase